MTRSLPRWMAWLWVAGGGLTIAAVLVGAVVAWILVGTAADAVTESTAVTRRALTTVGDTTEVVDAVFDDVAGSLRDVQTTLADTSLTLTSASAVTGNLTGVVTEEIPASIDSIRAALPALIDTASVIDSTMRGLALVGVDYDPSVPLDQSIADIDARLAAIPDLLRTQQETLSSVTGDLGRFSSSMIGLSDDVGSIRVRLAEASSALAGYTTIVADSSALLDDLESGLTAGVRLVRLTIVLLALGVTATQTLPISVGVLRLSSPTEAESDR